MENSLGGPGQGQGFSQPQIDWSKAEDVTCDECNSTYFTQVTMYKKVSKFATGAERDTLAPIPVIRCADCGHVNDDFKPQMPGQ